MKSLEIVNRNIKMYKKMLYNLKDTQVGTIEDFKKYNIECEIKEYQQIKQDLEVLEIIKKILIKIEYVNYKDKQTHCFVINQFVKNEDIERLKQWLEDNENDR